MVKLGRGGGLSRGWGRKKPKGINAKQLDKVMKSKKVHAAVMAKAKTVQVYWQSISPVFGDKPPHRKTPNFGHPGSYRDSVVVKDTSDDNGASARVAALDWKARMIEYGNAHMPEYAPMAKVKARFRK